MGRACTGERLNADERRCIGGRLGVDKIGRANFAPERAATGGGGAPLSTGGEVAVGLSGFSAWYFLRGKGEWTIPSTGSQMSSACVFPFQRIR